LRAALGSGSALGCGGFVGRHCFVGPREERTANLRATARVTACSRLMDAIIAESLAVQAGREREVARYGSVQ
jgi:hypothetical protein